MSTFLNQSQTKEPLLPSTQFNGTPTFTTLSTRSSLKTQTKDGFFTVVTPNSNAYDASHYTALMFDTELGQSYIFDSLMNAEDSNFHLNHYDDIGLCTEVRNALACWAHNNNWQFDYVVSLQAWQNTSDVMDAWCQTWTLLFQKKVLEGKNPFDICRENVSVQNRRSELMNLVQKYGTKSFEKDLQEEYLAQLKLHGADPRMKYYKARDLIQNANHNHFFEVY